MEVSLEGLQISAILEENHPVYLTPSTGCTAVCICLVEQVLTVTSSRTHALSNNKGSICLNSSTPIPSRHQQEELCSLSPLLRPADGDVVLQQPSYWEETIPICTREAQAPGCAGH